MERTEAAKFIGNAIAKAIAGGVHQMDVVAILEANKFNLLMQTYEQNKKGGDEGPIILRRPPPQGN